MIRPGCTKEACDFRDGFADYKKAGAVILGVSPDDVDSHAKFAKKFELPFSLLADPDDKICEAYGVWKEKNMYGKKYMGVERTTFVIDAQGDRPASFPKVKVDGHSAAVLEAIEAEQMTPRVEAILRSGEIEHRDFDQKPSARDQRPRASQNSDLAWVETVRWRARLSTLDRARAGNAERQLIAAVTELALELSEGLVFLVADPGDGQVQLVADLGHRPAAHPELDDAILAVGQYGPAGGLEDLAQLESIALRAGRDR